MRVFLFFYVLMGKEYKKTEREDNLLIFLEVILMVIILRSKWVMGIIDTKEINIRKTLMLIFILYSLIKRLNLF